ncbi:unnamed protein product [Adineta steineri]|uniref:Cell growth-regulating nucleolar protein-like winged helix domain-containing protein n=1 Tax=Adineta steineri TaxID=433720 RepID=A0A813TW98_9BILA|nr:unnamed protein product [Adineta steineri]CAF3866034.1 unnamed protein product [Adineta steineri]CAF3995071.1 unnamed protein product [Adineta steineri]
MYPRDSFVYLNGRSNNYWIKMNSHYTDIWSSSKTFNWTERIETIVRNSYGETITFDKLKKEIIKQYREVKPNSDKSTNELINQLEKNLTKAPFIGRLGNDIYYLYYFKAEKSDLYL